MLGVLEEPNLERHSWGVTAGTGLQELVGRPVSQPVIPGSPRIGTRLAGQHPRSYTEKFISEPPQS